MRCRALIASSRNTCKSGPSCEEECDVSDSRRMRGGYRIERSAIRSQFQGRFDVQIQCNLGWRRHERERKVVETGTKIAVLGLSFFVKSAELLHISVISWSETKYTRLTLTHDAPVPGSSAKEDRLLQTMRQVTRASGTRRLTDIQPRIRNENDQEKPLIFYRHAVVN